ncbi:alpha/beta-hydrolase [Coprinopsis marcescibilis]|uniref:Alpha/beta-hydrolase n=1 Tax=Coprinopsis marcescibilis TaxID=230819 RepID=A0A5C3KT34_COPMA|nr:alpha/beta-hydrolase [Coprinopsis marcescibilis]
MTQSKESPVLAGPIDDCCVQGVKHSGTPAGKSITIAGVSTYLSEPPALARKDGRAKVVLYFPDAYGPFYLNAQLLQDYYASHGFHVLGIDYFLGDPVHLHLDNPDFDRVAWVAKSQKQAQESVPKWIAEVKRTYGEDAVYNAIGNCYCFGGPYSIEAGSVDGVISVALAHPSRLNEDHFKNLTKPILLNCAEIDNAFPAESRRRAVDILIEKKTPFHVQLYSGIAHGFGTRADLSVENSRWAKEEAARSVAAWFSRWSSVNLAK